MPNQQILPLNINQIYQNTTQLQQELKPNDPFNFVDDLLKKK